MRVACLYVPELPLQALLRAEPSWTGAPLAVVEGEGARARVLAASMAARVQGVRPGQRIAEASAFCPGLQLRQEDPHLLQAAREAVLDAAAKVAPKVEEARPGVVWVGTEGLERLHGGEAGIARALLAAVERVGLDARVAIASGKRIAAIAALRGDGAELIPAGQERAFLGPLPLAALLPFFPGSSGPTLVETLARWGIGSAGALAALPEEGVAGRLGPEGLLLHRLASGVDEEPLQPRPQPEVFEESCAFDHEIALLEGLLFLLRPALERLVERLACHAFSCGGLELHLALEPAGEAVVPVEVAAPTREVTSLLALCRAALERRELGAPIRGLRLRALPAAARREQLRLFGRPTVAPEKLATAVAKAAAILGEDRVGSPRLGDSHRHEDFEWTRFDPPPPPEETSAERETSETSETSEATGVLHLFRPPLPAEVRVGRDRPQAIQAQAVVGWVVSCAGPWRLDQGWFEEPVRRDVFDVELSDGGVYRLGRDLGSGAWFLLGRYD